MTWIECQCQKDRDRITKAQWFFRPKGKRSPVYALTLSGLHDHMILTFSVKSKSAKSKVAWISVDSVPADLFAVMIYQLQKHLELPTTSKSF